jgi:hypothetical protein
LERNEAEPVTQVLDFKPGMVTFSCATGAHRWAADFAERIKRRSDVLTVFGGPRSISLHGSGDLTIRVVV